MTTIKFSIAVTLRNEAITSLFFPSLTDISRGYQFHLTTPYFIFVRDTLSFLLFLGLHYALCLSPSSLAFSGLEWAILVFFIGRLLVEQGQVRCLVKKRLGEKKGINNNESGEHSSIYVKAFISYLR